LSIIDFPLSIVTERHEPIPTPFSTSMSCITASWGAAADAPKAPEAPTSSGSSVKVSLFAAEPEIVTPIGATVDSHGHLFVIESNTHFRQKNYKGPEADRILILQDSREPAKPIR